MRLSYAVVVLFKHHIIIRIHPEYSYFSSCFPGYLIMHLKRSAKA